MTAGNPPNFSWIKVTADDAIIRGADIGLGWSPGMNCVLEIGFKRLNMDWYEGMAECEAARFAQMCAKQRGWKKGVIESDSIESDSITLISRVIG